MVKEYTHHVTGQPITSNSDHIAIDGHDGEWYVIDEITHKGRTVFLLEHETYGDEAAHIAVDTNGNIVCEEIYDNFPDCLDEQLRSMVRTQEMADEILEAAKEHFLNYRIFDNRINVVWDHDHWWVTFDCEIEDRLRTFNVVDCEDEAGEDYFDFEEV